VDVADPPESPDAPAGSPAGILKVGYAFRESKALLSAAELGVFTALAGGAAPFDELATRIGIAPRGARDFFDALVALRLLDRDSAGRYHNTPETAHYLVRGKESYIGAELEFFNAQLYRRWNALTAALRTGRPPETAGAEGHYADRYADPGAALSFARAMTSATLPVATVLTAKFPWADYATFADIGSAQGCLPVTIAAAHRHLTGIGFDLPPLHAVFDAYVQEHDLSGRVRFHPGDFLCDPLPRAEVLVLGRVLHNWDFATKAMLLQKAYEALPPGGAIIVYERLIDDERRFNATALLSSLNMLLMTAGGFDFSSADCIGWMHDAGFRNMRAEPITTDQTMIVGMK